MVRLNFGFYTVWKDKTSKLNWGNLYKNYVLIKNFKCWLFKMKFIHVIPTFVFFEEISCLRKLK